MGLRIFQVGVVLASILGPLAGSAATAVAAQQQQGRLIGVLRSHTVADGETLLDLARHYDLGFVELRAANPGVDPWVPRNGLELVLPTAHILPGRRRQGLIINLADQRAYYVPETGPVLSYPLGTGKSGWETPLGETKIVGKRRNPTWIPPPSIRAAQPYLPAKVPPGRDNPLGELALDLGWTSYVIHGTNQPYGVGRRVSHGCIRLYPEDIEILFDRVSVGTPVTVMDQPVKMGWVEDKFYLEVHPSQSQADEIEAQGDFTPAPITDLKWRIVQAAGSAAPHLNWPLIERVARERRGLPVQVSGMPRRPASAKDVSAGYLRSD